jgi:hypothetical protein
MAMQDSRNKSYQQPNVFNDLALKVPQLGFWCILLLELVQIYPAVNKRHVGESTANAKLTAFIAKRVVSNKVTEAERKTSFNRL